MNRKTFGLAVLLVFGGLVGFFIGGLGRNPQELPSALAGQPLPVLGVATPKRFFLVNVWGSWCAQCHEEHEFLGQLAAQIPIIGLNWAAANASEARDGAEFLRRRGNPYQTVIWQRDDLIVDLGVYGAPETFLVSPEGRILKRYAGPLNAQVWAREFQPLLEGQP